MKSKRRIVCIILTLILCMSVLLTACSKSFLAESNKLSIKVNETATISATYGGNNVTNFSAVAENGTTYVSISGNVITGVAVTQNEKITVTAEIDGKTLTATFNIQVSAADVITPCETHTDENDDNVCDVCGATIPAASCTTHTDADNNGTCDVCGATIPVTPCETHTDEDDDNVCDVCGATMEDDEYITNGSAKIFLAGDSTVKTYDEDQYIAGWGQYLSYFLDTENVTVINMSEGGRSSRSFINEGRLYDIEGNTVGKTSIESQIQAGDYLFIQFGHNDDNTKYTASPSSDYTTVFDRMVPLGIADSNGIYPTTAGTPTSTSSLPSVYTQYASASEESSALSTIGKYGSTYYSYDCGGTYKWYLKQYIDFARDVGAIPVLITPVARVKLNDSNVLQSGNGLHGTDFAYVEAVRQLASEEDCILIDLFAFSKDLIETSTKTYCDYLMALKPSSLVGLWPSGYDNAYNNTEAGYTGIEGTHYNKYGAYLLAAYVAEVMKNYTEKEMKVNNTEYFVFGDSIKTTPTTFVESPTALPEEKITEIAALYKKVTVDGENEPDTTPTVYIVGDSTLCDFSSSSSDAKYYYPRVGYGVEIGDFLDGVKVVNYAMSGRSSLSFLTESNYTALCSKITAGDYLIIAFGHNDEKAEAERYTNPNGSSTEQGSFKYVLYNYYIKVAEEVGATAVLCTPIVRRSTADNYEGSNAHITTDSVVGEITYAGGDYPKAIRELGEEKDVTVIDMTALTKALYISDTAAETLYYHAWTTSDSASVDNTHLNVYGATKMAYIFANALKQTTNSLATYVKADIAEPTKAATLVVNSNYTEIDYDPNYTPSTIWTNIEGDWEGSVFGDVGGASKINTTNYALSSSEGVFTLRAGIVPTTSVGKIATASDGLAFIFQQISADADFTLSATVKVKAIVNSNGQVSFGLMVRDDIYIDVHNAAISTNYVACGALKMANGEAGTYTAFTRNSGSIAAGTVGMSALPSADSTYTLSISKVGNTITANFNGTISTFTTDLNSVDVQYNYVGFFVSRCCEIEVSGVSLQITGDN